MSDKIAKSPYVNATIEDVMNAEMGNYYIQIGTDIFSTEQGLMAFSKERVEGFFQEVWDGLNNMKNSNDPQEQDDANKCLLHFRIIPLRIH